MSKKLEMKLRKGIFIVGYKEDETGKYIPYCKFERHSGIVEPRRADTCIKRGCDHYRRLYIK